MACLLQPSSGTPLLSSLMLVREVLEEVGVSLMIDKIIVFVQMWASTSEVWHSRRYTSPDGTLALSEVGILLLSENSEQLIDWVIKVLFFPPRFSEFLLELSSCCYCPVTESCPTHCHTFYYPSPFGLRLLFCRGDHGAGTGRVLAVPSAPLLQPAPWASIFSERAHLPCEHLAEVLEETLQTWNILL